MLSSLRLFIRVPTWRKLDCLNLAVSTELGDSIRKFKGRQLMKALVALLDKLQRWGDPNDEKITETVSAIMHHMSALIERSK